MKKLFIVCDDSCKKYVDFLSQLVSLKDDTIEKIVGVKDGEVAAVVWNEKQFEDNAPKMSTENYILFIGDSKSIKEKRANMIKQWSKFGMNYCWLGKQGTLFVDEIVDIKEYDDFIEFAKNHNENIEKKIKLLPTQSLKEENVNKENKQNLIMSAIKKASKIPANIVTAGVNKVNELSKKKEIEEQEYTCLVLEFYLNALSKFLDLDEE